MYTRRRVCALASSTVGALAGCGRDGPRLGLRRIRIFNTTSERTDVAIAVRAGGEVVYEDVHTVPAKDGVTAGSTEIVDESMHEPAAYSLSATDVTRGHATDAPSVSQFFDDVGDNDCFGVMLVVDEHRLSVGYSAHETCDFERG